MNTHAFKDSSEGIQDTSNVETQRILQSIQSNMQEILIPNAGNNKLFTQNILPLSELYLQVFSNPTWNDRRYDSIKQASLNSNNEVVRTLDQQKQSILDEIQGKNMISDFVEIDTHVQGFIYGWETNCIDLNREKFKLDETQSDLFLQSLVSEGYGIGDQGVYLSELGLREEYRGQGYGKQMFANFYEKSQGTQAKFLLLRTSQKRVFPYKYTIKNYGAKVLFSYNDHADNVILMIKL